MFTSVRVAGSSGAVTRRDFSRPFLMRSSGRGSGLRANLRKGVNLRVPPRLFGGQQVCVTQGAYCSRAPLTKWQVTLAKENRVEPSNRLPEPYKRCVTMPCKVQLIGEDDEAILRR